MSRQVRRFDVHLVNLDPTRGGEIQKTRPCLIVSPNELNRYIRTVIVAPLTGKARSYPTRVNCVFQGVSGQIVLDQIRTVDKTRLVKKLGTISRPAQGKVVQGLVEMFSE